MQRAIITSDRWSILYGLGFCIRFVLGFMRSISWCLVFWLMWHVSKSNIMAITKNMVHIKRLKCYVDRIFSTKKENCDRKIMKKVCSYIFIVHTDNSLLSEGENRELSPCICENEYID